MRNDEFYARTEEFIAKVVKDIEVDSCGNLIPDSSNTLKRQEEVRAGAKRQQKQDDICRLATASAITNMSPPRFGHRRYSSSKSSVTPLSRITPLPSRA